MSALNITCEEIIKKVTSSKLDFQIKQTPYSIFFSIRRKFAKHSDEQNVTSHAVEPPAGQSLVERLQQELLMVRNEYHRLYAFYEEEIEKTNNLNDQLQTLYEHVQEKEVIEKELEAKHKKELVGNKNLQTNLEIKSIEVKNQKSEIETLKKDKNTLSVALKTSKQEMKEQKKAFEKKVNEYEKKILELNAYREKKLCEEREEKLRKKKELKKARKNNMEKIVDPKKNPEHGTAVPLLPEQVFVVESKEGISEIEVKIVDLNLNYKTLVKKEPENLEIKSKTELKPETEAAGVNGEVIDENDLTFIGPRLPRRMTEEEIEIFRKELFAKYFPI